MSPRGASGPEPDSVEVRMFQMGFGDNFLLTFGYPEQLADGRSERHVLIDFGSTRWPKGHKARYVDVAQSIEERTGGRLDVVVMTHRHKDHLSGFGDPEAGEILQRLRPALVIRPWTEHPDAAADASGPLVLGDESRRFAKSLAAAQEFAGEVSRALADGARGYRGELAHMAAEQLANRAAIDRLDALAGAAEHGGRYLHAGQDSGIEQVIPGISVAVLGPPTPEEWPAVTGQRANDPEYWIRRRGLLEQMLVRVEAGPAERSAAIAAEADPLDPGPARWLVERMRDQQTHSLLRIVRSLDDAMNNTSVILLFRAGERRLLFPGDAQIENWSYSLTSKDAASLRTELPEVDLYKVGHHGSRNATPRSLVKLWEPRRGKITSMLSTMPEVHGHTEATAVPRATLVEALEDLGRLERTDSLPPEALFLQLSGSTADREPFAAAG